MSTDSYRTERGFLSPFFGATGDAFGSETNSHSSLQHSPPTTLPSKVQYVSRSCLPLHQQQKRSGTPHPTPSPPTSAPSNGAFMLSATSTDFPSDMSCPYAVEQQQSPSLTGASCSHDSHLQGHAARLRHHHSPIPSLASTIGGGGAPFPHQRQPHCHISSHRASASVCISTSANSITLAAPLGASPHTSGAVVGSVLSGGVGGGSVHHRPQSSSFGGSPPSVLAASTSLAGHAHHHQGQGHGQAPSRTLASLLFGFASKAKPFGVVSARGSPALTGHSPHQRVPAPAGRLQAPRWVLFAMIAAVMFVAVVSFESLRLIRGEIMEADGEGTAVAEKPVGEEMMVARGFVAAAGSDANETVIASAVSSDNGPTANAHNEPPSAAVLGTRTTIAVPRHESADTSLTKPLAVLGIVSTDRSLPTTETVTIASPDAAEPTPEPTTGAAASAAGELDAAEFVAIPTKAPTSDFYASLPNASANPLGYIKVPGLTDPLLVAALMYDEAVRTNDPSARRRTFGPGCGGGTGDDTEAAFTPTSVLAFPLGSTPAIVEDAPQAEPADGKDASPEGNADENKSGRPLTIDLVYTFVLPSAPSFVANMAERKARRHRPAAARAWLRRRAEAVLESAAKHLGVGAAVGAAVAASPNSLAKSGGDQIDGSSVSATHSSRVRQLFPTNWWGASEGNAPPHSIEEKSNARRLARRAWGRLRLRSPRLVSFDGFLSQSAANGQSPMRRPRSAANTPSSTQPNADENNDGVFGPSRDDAVMESIYIEFMEKMGAFKTAADHRIMDGGGERGANITDGLIDEMADLLFASRDAATARRTLRTDDISSGDASDGLSPQQRYHAANPPLAAFARSDTANACDVHGTKKTDDGARNNKEEVCRVVSTEAVPPATLAVTRLDLSLANRLSLAARRAATAHRVAMALTAELSRELSARGLAWRRLKEQQRMEEEGQALRPNNTSLMGGTEILATTSAAEELGDDGTVGASDNVLHACGLIRPSSARDRTNAKKRRRGNNRKTTKGNTDSGSPSARRIRCEEAAAEAVAEFLQWAEFGSDRPPGDDHDDDGEEAQTSAPPAATPPPALANGGVDGSVSDQQRYRDWDEILYSLRGNYYNLMGGPRYGGGLGKGIGPDAASTARPSTVRNIYIVVSDRDQAPPWLRSRGTAPSGATPLERDFVDRIVLVEHRELVPPHLQPTALPTFNSYAIEALLHRIPGIARHYIYFNNDMLLARPVSFFDYFQPYVVTPRPAKGTSEGGAAAAPEVRWLPLLMANRLTPERCGSADGTRCETKSAVVGNHIRLFHRMGYGVGQTRYLLSYGHLPHLIDRDLMGRLMEGRGYDTRPRGSEVAWTDLPADEDEEGAYTNGEDVIARRVLATLRGEKGDGKGLRHPERDVFPVLAFTHYQMLARFGGNYSQVREAVRGTLTGSPLIEALSPSSSSDAPAAAASEGGDGRPSIWDAPFVNAHGEATRFVGKERSLLMSEGPALNTTTSRGRITKFAMVTTERETLLSHLITTARLHREAVKKENSSPLPTQRAALLAAVLEALRAAHTAHGSRNRRSQSPHAFPLQLLTYAPPARSTHTCANSQSRESAAQNVENVTCGDRGDSSSSSSTSVNDDESRVVGESFVSTDFLRRIANGKSVRLCGGKDKDPEGRPDKRLIAPAPSPNANGAVAITPNSPARRVALRLNAATTTITSATADSTTTSYVFRHTANYRPRRTSGERGAHDHWLLPFGDALQGHAIVTGAANKYYFGMHHVHSNGGGGQTSMYDDVIFRKGRLLFLTVNDDLALSSSSGVKTHPRIGRGFVGAALRSAGRRRRDRGSGRKMLSLSDDAKGEAGGSPGKALISDSAGDCVRKARLFAAGAGRTPTDGEHHAFTPDARSPAIDADAEATALLLAPSLELADRSEIVTAFAEKSLCALSAHFAMNHQKPNTLGIASSQKSNETTLFAGPAAADTHNNSNNSKLSKEAAAGRGTVMPPTIWPLECSEDTVGGKEHQSSERHKLPPAIINAMTTSGRAALDSVAGLLRQRMPRRKGARGSQASSHPPQSQVNVSTARSVQSATAQLFAWRLSLFSLRELIAAEARHGERLVALTLEGLRAVGLLSEGHDDTIASSAPLRWQLEGNAAEQVETAPPAVPVPPEARSLVRIFQAFAPAQPAPWEKEWKWKNLELM